MDGCWIVFIHIFIDFGPVLIGDFCFELMNVLDILLELLLEFVVLLQILLIQFFATGDRLLLALDLQQQLSVDALLLLHLLPHFLHLLSEGLLDLLRVFLILFEILLVDQMRGQHFFIGQAELLQTVLLDLFSLHEKINF